MCAIHCDKLHLVDTRSPVMNGRPLPRPAGRSTTAAPVAIPREHLVARAGEMPNRVLAPRVAGKAEAGDGRQATTIQAEKLFWRKSAIGQL